MKPISMKEMCEHILKAGFTWKDGSVPTPEEIFNYSPTGELSEVFFWYYEACFLIGPPEGHEMPEPVKDFLKDNDSSNL